MIAAENLPHELRGRPVDPQRMLETALRDIDEQLKWCSKKHLEHFDLSQAYNERLAQLSKARDKVGEALVKVMS